MEKTDVETVGDVLLRLYRLGLNVVPVDDSKKPLVKWSAKSRVKEEKLESVARRALGIALIGGHANPRLSPFILVIADIDDPTAVSRSPTLESLIEKTVFWKTGVRCPACLSKNVQVLNPGRFFKCSKCGKEFTTEEAMRGLGALFLISTEDARKAKLTGTKRFGDIELLINNYQLIPPSLHPSGVHYEWVRTFDENDPHLGIAVITYKDILRIKKELGFEGEETGRRRAPGDEAKPLEIRELSDSDVQKIVDALRDCYKPGNRQFIALFLSGWLAKARISPVSAVKIIKKLHEETGDTDSLQTRLSAVVYSYKKAGIDLSPFASIIESIAEKAPYGLEREIEEEKIKGISGLQEVLENVVGEERALSIIKQIQETIGALSPFRDSIITIMNYDRQTFVVADLRRLRVVTAERREDGGREFFAYKDIIFLGVPSSLEVYINPLGDVTKFKMVWETRSRPNPIEIGPTTIDYILARLRLEGLVGNKKLAEDALQHLIEAYITKKRAVVREEADAQGFFVYKNGIYVNANIKEPRVEELTEALQLLNALAIKYFKRSPEKFATVIKWGIIHPFIFARKQLGREYQVPDLVLYGARNTGKTTLAEIATVYIWGLPREKHSVSFSEANTEYKYGNIISKTTFAVIINECNSIFYKPEIINLIKAKVENTIARGRYEGGFYRQYLALSPVIYTLNPSPPVNFDSLELVPKTVWLLEFIESEKPSMKEIEEFNKEVVPSLHKLKAIGYWVAQRIQEMGVEALKEEWTKLAEELLKEAYTVAGMSPPNWVTMLYTPKTFEEVLEEKKVRIIEVLKRAINEAYVKNIGRIRENTAISMTDKLLQLLGGGFLEWIITPPSPSSSTTVCITSSVLHVLNDVQVTNLRDLAEILEMPDKYKAKKSIRAGSKVYNVSCIEITVDELGSLLEPFS